MSIRKRALSLLLVLVMLLGVLPAGAAAAEVYQDVPSGHWASDYIARVAEQGLMVGTSDTTFAPEETITRAMFVTILARYAKAETDNNAETAFTDVPAGQYYTGAVAWAAANGIVNGTSAVTFAPNDPVTREQMAALLYRAMRFLGNKCPQDGKLDAFSDASALSDWAVEGMIWAAGAGLFGGFEDGTLRPQETATRAQAAKVFCVLLDYSEQPEPTEPSDRRRPARGQSRRRACWRRRRSRTASFRPVRQRRRRRTEQPSGAPAACPRAARPPARRCPSHGRHIPARGG